MSKEKRFVSITSNEDKSASYGFYIGNMHCISIDASAGDLLSKKEIEDFRLNHALVYEAIGEEYTPTFA